MLKQNELRKPSSCLNKASFDEPIFVLRAKDPHAPQAVRLWATMAIGHHEQDKINEAVELADHMEKWRSANVPQTAAEVVSAPPRY